MPQSGKVCHPWVAASGGIPVRLSPEVERRLESPSAPRSFYYGPCIDNSPVAKDQLPEGCWYPSTHLAFSSEEAVPITMSKDLLFSQSRYVSSPVLFSPATTPPSADEALKQLANALCALSAEVGELKTAIACSEQRTTAYVFQLQDRAQSIEVKIDRVLSIVDEPLPKKVARTVLNGVGFGVLGNFVTDWLKAGRLK